MKFRLNSIVALEPALWRRLTNSADLESMVGVWLALQCQIIVGTTRGIVLLDSDTPNSFKTAAIWPEGSGRSAALAEAAELAIRERRGITTGDAVHGVANVAFPILLGEDLKGVVAVALRGERGDEVRAALRNLQWGVAWIRDRLRQARGDKQDRLLDRSRTALDLLGDALGREGFEASAMAVVTALTSRSGCSRVSLGVRSGTSVAVKVISHSAQFGQRMVLVSGLAAAMDEALDQNCLILYPAPPEQAVATSAHAELSRVQRDGQVLTIPMLVADHLVGAMTFERPIGMPFEQDTVALLELATSIVGPVLEEKRLNDRWVIVKLFESSRNQLVRLFGPGHLGRKLIATAVVVAALALSLIQNVYKVDADAKIEGLVRRAVVAPYDGFIKESMARPGDMAKEGQTLASLEDRDLLLERLKWVTERQQRLFEYDKALAARQPAATNVARAQMNQAEAQIKLADAQLARNQLRSPIDGHIVSGDLSQLIGTAVQRGQVLFEVAPLDAYRVILDVDEREVGEVSQGQTGQLVVTALPTRELPFVLEKITPISDVHGGRNVFRVEGRLTENPPELRPGMEGIGKIEIGKRNIAWIWLHPLIDSLRLWSWRWVW